MCGWRFRPIMALRHCQMFAKTLRLPAANLDTKALREQINSLLSKKYGRASDYVLDLDYPLAWLNEGAFGGVLPAHWRNKRSPKPKPTLAKP